jgi:2-polyprenyl-3-methyl-5-hydroxy-6-metoxy-1,4-benzoquinol methylase
MTDTVFDPKTHWETVYTNKASDNVSWYQDYPHLSMEMIKHSGVMKSGQIIDVGSGATRLMSALLDEGYQSVTALDISETALRVAQKLLGARAGSIQWKAADICTVELPSHHYDLWHDRAVLHFLTGIDQRAAYLQTLRKALKPGGTVILATFAPDGPTQCSNLDVVRYGANDLTALLGDDFQLIESRSEAHTTPWSSQQQFTWCRFQRR